jgi:glucose-6-phosphate 1-epimerase
MPSHPLRDRLTEVHGQSAIALVAPDGASAVVLLHGAHIVSWRPAGGSERLFLSERSRYGEGAAVRGGIPVVFPQFSERGPLPRHGLSRTRPWQLLRAETGADDALAVLGMNDDESTRAIWPHAFALELTVCVRGNRLDVELAATNTGTSSFDFTAALHTYLRVDAVETARLSGLHGCRYENTLDGSVRVETQETLRVDREIDRVYFAVKRPLRLSAGKSKLLIAAERFPDAVVWNPWQDKAAALDDLAPADFTRFLCVESALIGQPQTLAPAAEWWGRQCLIAD